MFEPKLWTKPTNTKRFVKKYLNIWIDNKKRNFDGEINIFLTNAKFYDSSARKEGNFFGPLINQLFRHFIFRFEIFCGQYLVEEKKMRSVIGYNI
ncbi:MAG: hypothetical protein ACLRPQ_01730 [Streptococcus sp.]